MQELVHHGNMVCTGTMLCTSTDDRRPERHALDAATSRRCQVARGIVALNGPIVCHCAEDTDGP